jgi:hypothetical protein
VRVRGPGRRVRAAGVRPVGAPDRDRERPAPSSDPANVRRFAAMGARYVTLTWDELERARRRRRRERSTVA